MLKHESICLGNGKKRLQSASGYPNNSYKNTQTAPTTTHGRSNQQVSAEMTPLALSSVFCKFKVNLLEPSLSQTFEPKATDILWLVSWQLLIARWKKWAAICSRRPSPLAQGRLGSRPGNLQGQAVLGVGVSLVSNRLTKDRPSNN